MERLGTSNEALVQSQPLECVEAREVRSCRPSALLRAAIVGHAKVVRLERG
jgi:hypothetical protein